jgi:hypothetical protein
VNTPTSLRAHLSVFWRGFLIVSLTSSNVAQIAGGHWLGAFLNGFAISFVWWQNSRAAAHSTATYGREGYALGAACGTVAGMWLVRAIYR